MARRGNNSTEAKEFTEVIPDESPYTYVPDEDGMVKHPISEQNRHGANPAPVVHAYGSKIPRPSNATARLVNRVTGEYIWLWIEDFAVDLSIAGSTAQSRYYREFYPRSFNQPQFVVQGRTTNDYEYNRLAQFVRQSQVNALGDGKVPLIFQMPPRAFRGGVKPRRGWQMQGYIGTIAAGAQHHNPAPPYQFNFILSYSHYDTAGNVGLWQDSHAAAQSKKIVDWMQIIRADEDEGVNIAFGIGAGKGKNFTSDDEDLDELGDLVNIFGDNDTPGDMFNIFGDNG